MLLTLLCSAALLFVAPAVPFFVHAGLRKRAFLLYPPTVALQFALVAFLSGLAHSWLSYRSDATLSIFFVSTLLTWLLAVGMARSTRLAHAWESPRVLLWVLGATVLCLADSFVIGARQGWHLEGIVNPPGYFRIPFNEDVMRNVAVVNGLIRGTESALLPGFSNTYQLFWYHFAARGISLFHSQSAYPLVMGISLCTALVFTFLLFWVFALIRPGWWNRFWWAGMLVVLFTSHADLINGLWSLVVTGRWGIEADWSMGHVNYFRYISPKFLSLIAPQHAFFFVFFLPYLAIFLEGRLGALRHHRLVEALFFVCCFLASPIMTYVVFPFLWVGRALGSPQRLQSLWAIVPKLITFSILGVIAFRAATGFIPTELFLRTGSTTFTWLPWIPDQWKLAPLLLVETLGVLGLLVLCLLILRFRSFFSDLRRFPYLFALLVGLLFFNFAFTSPELRRHFTIIGTVFAILYVLRSLPSYGRFIRAPIFAWSLGVASFLVLGMHGYYVYSFTGKPNVLAQDIPWRDYFAINRIVKENFPHLATVAAVSSDQGIAKPIIMEVTTSFAQSVDSYTHARVPAKTFSLLRKVEMAGCVLPYARALGYRAFVWGPVEERTWGEKAAKRFKAPERLLARAGNVELYLWGDVLKEEHALRRLPQGEESEYVLGDALQQSGWSMEAIDHYLGALHSQPRSWRAHEGMGKSLEALGLKRAAQTHFEHAQTFKKNSN